MPTKLISEYLEDDGQGLEVFLDNDVIIFQLSDSFAIKYVESGGSTIVHCKKANEDSIVEGSMIQVFCEDFKQFLVDRKTVLASLEAFDSTFDTETQNQVFEFMELALKSKEGKFQVKNIWLDIFNTEQMITLLKFIDPEILASIHFNSPDVNELVTFLSNWNKGSRLDVSLERCHLSKENLASVKQIFDYPSVFSQVKIFCEDMNGWGKEQLISLFRPFKPTIMRAYYFEFKLQDPLEQDEEQVDSLCPWPKVFEDPLLMGRILNKIECFDIQRLRKMSRGIRSCIDDLKPDPNVERCFIIQKGPDDRLDSYQKDTFDFFIKSRNDLLKCVRYRSRELLIENENDWHVTNFVYCGDQLIERVVNDFKINIEHQKSTMDRLDLDCNGEFSKLIGDVWKSRDNLSVKELRMKIGNEKDIMSILPYLDSVELIGIESRGNLKFIDAQKFWGNAIELKVEGCTIMNSIQKLNVLNFQKIYIKINSITSRDVIYLKENLVNSVNLVNFTIFFENSLIGDLLYISLPPFQRIPYIRTTWYFQMPNPNRFLKIIYDEEEEMIFCCQITRDLVPGDFLNAL